MNKYGALVNAYRFELTANYDNRERLLFFNNEKLERNGIPRQAPGIGQEEGFLHR